MSPSGFLSRVRARLHGGGGPQVGEVARLSTLSLILIWSRLHDRWGGPLHVTSPICGPPPPCKQAIKLVYASEYNHLSTLPTTGDIWRMKGVFTGSTCVWKTQSGAANVNLRKTSVRKMIWDLEFSEHFLSNFLLLPASPRIFKHLKNGIIAHF